MNIFPIKTSKSGIVPAIAPQSIALFPIRLPATASPTAAPNVICVNESITRKEFYVYHGYLSAWN